MAKVILSLISETEEDGFEGQTVVMREGVDDIYHLLEAYTDFAIATGYTYVANVFAVTENGKEFTRDW